MNFGLRFWKGGTPRLTAYEYQGLLLSQGHERTNLTCISCHNMHGGDRRGMIQLEMRGNRGCLQCHDAIARNVRAHTHHEPSGSGSGDVVQRAVAAHALAQESSYTTDPVARLWAVPFLLLTMEDRYPAVRHFAYRGLVTLCERAGVGGRPSALPAFDYLADAPARSGAIERWWVWWHALDKRGIPHPGSAVPLDQDLMPVHSDVALLTARQTSNVIAIGE